MGKLSFLFFLISGVVVAYYLFRPPPPIPKASDGYFGAGNWEADDTAIRPFSVNVSDAVIADLRRRLAASRFVSPVEDARFHYGANAEVMKRINAYWKDKYDWRKAEKELNAFPQFRTQIEGLDVHFVRARPAGLGADVRVYPLLIVHGWPGSVYEFYKEIPFDAHFKVNPTHYRKRRREDTRLARVRNLQS